MATLSINTPKYPSPDYRRLARRSDIRIGVAAAVWLALAAAVPVSAIVVAAGHDTSAASSPHVAPYIEAKIGGPSTR